MLSREFFGMTTNMLLNRLWYPSGCVKRLIAREVLPLPGMPMNAAK